MGTHRWAVPLALSVAVSTCLDVTIASAQAFKIAHWNIKSGTGMDGFSTGANIFNGSDTTCTTNAWGMGYVQQFLNTYVKNDPAVVALVVNEVLGDHGLTGFPKTSGKRGIHVNVRVEPRWDFTEVRRAALALAREVERRVPDIATTAWWKEQRHGVFIDYNQNARDRTVASAYSVRPVPDARVSCPLAWDEVAGVDPSTLRLDTVPKRFAETGDPGATIDEHAGLLDSLLDLARRDEEGGLGDAPWPPHFPKAKGEPRRVSPSRARKDPPEE